MTICRSACVDELTESNLASVVYVCTRIFYVTHSRTSRGPQLFDHTPGRRRRCTILLNPLFFLITNPVGFASLNSTFLSKVAHSYFSAQLCSFASGTSWHGPLPMLLASSYLPFLLPCTDKAQKPHNAISTNVTSRITGGLVHGGNTVVCACCRVPRSPCAKPMCISP
jgi:hypothetical protein